MAYGCCHNPDTTANAAAATAIETSTPDLEVFQKSMDEFAILSKHCPMTPLLWMQYAHDTEVLVEGLMMLESSSNETEGGDDQQQRLQQMQAKKGALESSTGILELALAEFPGCALLHLFYLESLADYVHQCEGLRQLNAKCGAVVMEAYDRQATIERLNAAFDIAWTSVGRGTHVNEGMVVTEIYRLHGSFLLFQLSSVAADIKSGAADHVPEIDTILQQLSSLFEKWSKTPMGEGSNDEMMQDLECIWDEACSLVISVCDSEQQKLKRKQDLEQQKLSLWENIDNERKRTSSLTNILSSNENEVDVAMSNEGIALPWQSLFPDQQKMVDSNDFGISRHTQSLKRSITKWNQILLSDTIRFLFGLGGSETSRAFSKSASFLQRTYQDIAKNGKSAQNCASILQEHFVTHTYTLIGSMYERALSECPTIESLWISYLNFLIRLRNESEEPDVLSDLSNTLQSVSHRAIRNCPYSSTLFEMRMNILGLTSVSNLEPDDISAVMQEATELGFLNHNREAMLHLRLVAIHVVKRKLLASVSLGTTSSANGPGKDYDQCEEMGLLSVPTKKKSTQGMITYQSLNPAAVEEAQDLIEDIRDMYDEADNFLFKSHSAWSEGKVSFWKHRALTEAYALCPIGQALKKSLCNGDVMDDEIESEVDKEAIRCFEKLVKAQKPSHPDSWREYIRYVSASHLYGGIGGNSAQSQPDGVAVVASTLRRTRGLYQKAMSSVKKAGQATNNISHNMHSWLGKGIDSTMFHRDYDTALSDLSREYLEFERIAGSEESLSHAITLVRSKLANWNPSLVPAVAITNEVDPNGKRKLDTSNDVSMPDHGSSMLTDDHEQQDEEEVGNQSKSKRAKVKTDLKQPKKTDGVHKVRIGKMEYPAHPYTIHVSKLSKDTEDMDLVDAFRSEFGAVVHAKIMREKITGNRGHHYHGESKCSGLVQFEERMSAEGALQKDGEFEVGGKVIKIQRSHLPAVGIVPAGMHRVKPKGEGRMSKRNKQKKESRMKIDTNQSMDVKEKAKGGKASADRGKNGDSITSPSALSLGVLSFKPRGMRQKPKIALGESKQKK